MLELANVRRAAEGTRNATLNQAAFNLAQTIDVAVWRAELEQAGRNPRPAHRMPGNGAVRPVETLPSIDGHTEPERSPWRHVDPDTAKAIQEHPPAFLAREDGTRLFYPGKVNGLIGESESGKTWVALLAVQQALDAGQAVLYLDFEDTYSGITGRLTAMGADLARFHYTSPDVALNTEHRAALVEDLELIRPPLIILDGFNAAMTLLGLDLNSNTDATRFAQELLRPLSKTGACVAYVDHLPKNREFQGKGGIGAQAKRAMTTGCAIRVDVVDEFGKGQTGRLKLTVDKDRPGLVRAIAAGAKHLGHAVLTSSPLGDAVQISIDPEGGSKPTTLMGRVMDYLSIVGQATKAQIQTNVEGNNEAIYKAIDHLENEGKVRITDGPRRSLIVTATTSPRDNDLSRESSPLSPDLRRGRGEVTEEDSTGENWWQK